jgi:hypothetical protein
LFDEHNLDVDEHFDEHNLDVDEHYFDKHFDYDSHNLDVDYAYVPTEWHPLLQRHSVLQQYLQRRPLQSVPIDWPLHRQQSVLQQCLQPRKLRQPRSTLSIL